MSNLSASQNILSLTSDGERTWSQIEL